MKKISSVYWRAVVIMGIVFCVLMLLSCIKPFNDAYTTYIYCFISDLLGRLTNWIPFAIGEIIMYAGAAIVICLIIISVLLIFLHSNEGYKGFAVKYMKIVFITVLAVLIIYELNWLIPFRSSYISFPDVADRTYSIEELQTLRNYIVEEMNSLASEALRDSEGHLLVSDSIDGEVVEAMRSLSDTYPRLGGYYPRMKKAFCTDILDVMRIGGYTYPYTMEITFNAYENGRMYYPVLYAHELCHHHGYYQEDEADFLSYIGCIGSESSYIRYMGYHQMYYVVENAYSEALVSITGDVENARIIYRKQPQVSEQVLKDEVADEEKFIEAYQSESIHASEKVKKYAKEAAVNGWSMQEKILDEKYYSGSLQLLLQYFDGKLY